jgi:hypothetical protein
MLNVASERLAQRCTGFRHVRNALENTLTAQLRSLPSCKYLQELDEHADQTIANATARAWPG